jgi:hypothetical protein
LLKRGFTVATDISPSIVKDDEFLHQLETLVEVYKEKKQLSHPKVPLKLFSNRSLGVLEVLVKYLRENQALSYSDIAMMLNRNDRTIWATYRKAAMKHGERFAVGGQELGVPCNIFIDRKLGPLQALTLYTKKELNMSFNEISSALKRDYRTVWLSYQNGVRKRCAHA